jgi:hypothetical protein
MWARQKGVVWYKEPSLLLFFGAKIGLVLYVVFVGIHNQYTGDFGPFVAVHDGQVDVGAGVYVMNVGGPARELVRERTP